LPNQTPSPALQNHFQAGLKTEFTGLNFPENAATDTQNCVYTLTGDVNRRGGVNYEANFKLNQINLGSVALSSYRWKNVGGDGQTQMLVQQIGSNLYFYLSTSATIASPLSTTLLSSVIDMTRYQAKGNTNTVSLTECQFADGNGFLIVYHQDCDPFYCTFNSANQMILSTPITFQIRDVTGIPEPGVADNFRPSSLSNEHTYNLTNQGWTKGSPWSGQVNANSGPAPTGGTIIGASWTVPVISQTNTTSLTNGSVLSISGSSINAGGFTQTTTITGTVTSYVTPFTSITLTVSSCNTGTNGTPDWGIFSGGTAFHNPNETLSASLVNQGFITTWFGSQGNYPANSDVWWAFKDTMQAFNPGLMAANTQQNVSAAPKGVYLLNPWIQQRTAASGTPGLTDITTTTRPSTGAWFNGRVFYSGVNASQQPTGDEPYYTWTENIYFSQVIETPSQFGKCYQTNDPTSQNLFNILPTDGGVITIQGCGAIYKLFALRYGLLVFASNGVWFLGGSTGQAFSADDYTVIKISSIESVSGTSFIDVQGLPFFWNEEGIYRVVPSQQPGSAHSPDIQLDVQNMCVGTILTYYQGFPLISKKFARGDYDQLNYIIQWAFRSTQETNIGDRYFYDTILNFNTVTGAFYPYTLPASSLTNHDVICDIKYMQSPGGGTSPPPVFKYITRNNSLVTFSEENDFTNYVDFKSGSSGGINYTSYFVTGYVLPGQGIRKIQIPYVYLFFREPTNTGCQIQSLWDFASAGASGKWSPKQLITNNIQNFAMLYRRIRLPGRGMAVQIKVTSVPGVPFDVMGWSVWNVVNAGV
jgi:hypothetical protein